MAELPLQVIESIGSPNEVWVLVIWNVNYMVLVYVRNTLKGMNIQFDCDDLVPIRATDSQDLLDNILVKSTRCYLFLPSVSLFSISHLDRTLSTAFDTMICSNSETFT
jgi:hypothetical protein